MINRWIVFAACMIVGGGLGFWARTVNGLSFGLGIGLAVAAMVWLVIDSFFINRLLRWLRAEQSNETPAVMAGNAPSLPGVWGDHVFIEERTVDVHVKRLREALGSAGTMVETVRGAGYRLTAMSANNPVAAAQSSA